MRQQMTRIMLASEYPEARHLLTEMIGDSVNGVIVGQAENAVRALTLARQLRPDVAIIDSDLPHVLGVDAIPLSRMGGLDAAQAISEEIPQIRVILMGNMRATAWSDRSLSPSDVAVLFSAQEMATGSPLVLQDIFQEMARPGTLVLADFETSTDGAVRRKVAAAGDKAIIVGGLGILGGLLVMPSMSLGVYGVVLASVGGALLLLGMIGSVAALKWPGASRRTARSTRD